MIKREGYQAVVDSPLGRIGIKTTGDQISGLCFLASANHLKKPVDPLAEEVVKQLVSYFEDPTFSFDLPIVAQGTDFQQRVWKSLQKIKSGSTLTYGELANRIKSGARAVGNSCRHNPVPIIVPCHRVVAARGIGGYAGKTKGPVHDRKRWLLAHEGLDAVSRS